MEPEPDVQPVAIAQEERPPDLIPARSFTRRAGERLVRLLGPEPADRPAHLVARWIFLRLLGLWFLSAFYSLAFQIRGLVGPQGILPAGGYLETLARSDLGWARFFYAPTLLWLGASDRALLLLAIAGLLASAALVLDLWPRASIVACEILFLSFIAAARAFASYQSDGMLLEAGLLSFFFAPRGLRPGLGARHPPSTASRLLLLWEWFRIYFESGVVKLLSGDPEWRHLTAMDHYYQNGPLPSWIGWYVAHLPHAFHAGTALATLLIENVLIWAVLLPRRFRLWLFCLVTALQIGIILTANYAFLNYLVLSLGFLLVDDATFARVQEWLRARLRWSAKRTAAAPATLPAPSPACVPPVRWRLWGTGLLYSWLVYVTVVVSPLAASHVPRWALDPAEWLEPFRVANRYGLFAVMTEPRYEIEFQGTRDGVHWLSYPFRYKPQALDEAPGLYAPYQPRFEWNLWFASLGEWRRDPWVVRTESLLLENVPEVLALFRGDPFPDAPPVKVRAVLWEYWFSSWDTKRETGRWWERADRGLYAPVLERLPDGSIQVAAEPPPTADSDQ